MEPVFSSDSFPTKGALPGAKPSGGPAYNVKRGRRTKAGMAPTDHTGLGPFRGRRGHFQALGITSVQATATLQALKIVVWGKGVGNKNWRGVPIKKLGASWDPLGTEN